jgi:hypothetical protein
MLWASVKLELREQALVHVGTLGLLGTLMLLLQQQSCVDAEEVIARWPDGSSYEAVIVLAKRPSALGDAALEKEFAEGLAHLVKTHQSAQRRAQLAQQNDPSISDLRSFVRRSEAPDES